MLPGQETTRHISVRVFCFGNTLFVSCWDKYKSFCKQNKRLRRCWKI
jgi:hypothetical protein